MIRAVLGALLFAVACGRVPEGPVELRGGEWSVTIDPATLAAEAVRLADGRRVVVSLPAVQGAPASGLSVRAQRAEWRVEPGAWSVAVSLDDEGFRVAIRGEAGDEISWPVLGEPEGFDAYILPKGEGFYIPVAERPWRDFLLKQSPIETMSGLSMPFVGVRLDGLTLTYVFENPFDNELIWEETGGELAGRLRHRFPTNQPGRPHELLVRFGGDSPVEPARQFRDWLQRRGEFRTLREKIAELPEAERLLGAAHVYLWANGSLAAADVANWRPFVRALAGAGPGEPLRAVFEKLPPEAQAQVREAAGGEYVSAWHKRAILSGLDAALAGDPAAQAAGERFLVPLERRGSAVSPSAMRRLREAGFDRLWLGLAGDEIDIARRWPETVRTARETGYLIGPYDSYHSIHSPDEADTWPTAQFDRALWESGGIVRADGSFSAGFQGKGRHLSSLAAKPHVRPRVEALLAGAPFNSWFVDCDATGELFDNYAPAFAHTAEEDMRLRLDRMQWLIGGKRQVVGSEVGAWFAASTIHFGHGMTTPLFGFGDPLLRDESSPHFLGKYAPPEGPDLFFHPVDVPEPYLSLYFDPRYRLPLYQTAFHDAIVTTDHWTFGALKFPNVERVRELLEALYGLPPLYHLNAERFAEIVPRMAERYREFSPAHREIGLLPMTAFEWLSEDRLVQRSVFGGRHEVVVNFGDKPRDYAGAVVPARGFVRRTVRAE